MDRRKFISGAMALGAGFVMLNGCKPGQSLTAEFVKDPFDIEMVREFVLHAHSSIDKVKAHATLIFNLDRPLVQSGAPRLRQRFQYSRLQLV